MSGARHVLAPLYAKPSVGSDIHGQYLLISEVDGRTIALVYDGEAHAESIARACNTHDAAREALRKGARRITQLADMVNTYSRKLGLGRKVYAEDYSEELTATRAAMSGDAPADSYEARAVAAGWVKYARGQDVIPPDDEQEWWYHRDAPDGDWFNTARECCDADTPAAPTQAFEPWERRGSAIYTEDDGTPGTARLVADLHGLPYADGLAEYIIGAHNQGGVPDHRLPPAVLRPSGATPAPGIMDEVRNAVDLLALAMDEALEYAEKLADLNDEPEGGSVRRLLEVAPARLATLRALLAKIGGA